MKKIALFCFSLFTISSSLLAQNWLWGKCASGAGTGDLWFDHSAGVDASGNAFYTGQFSAIMKFGAYTINAASSYQDAFLVKYNASGTALWAKQATLASSYSSAMGFSTVADPSGNIYITGNFSDTISFGTFGMTGQYGSNNMFLVKYSANGNVVWAKQANLIHAASACGGASLASDSKGNIYVAGLFEDTITLGAVTLRTQSGFIYQSFLAKYDPNGNVLWAKQSTCPGHQCSGQPYSVALDGTGNAYITGEFYDTISFGSFTLRERQLSDFFLVKYDTGGNVLWANQAILATDSSTATGYSVTVDGNGNSYVIGDFTDTVSFGTNKISSSGPTNGNEIFLAKYSPSGNIVWTKQSYQVNSDAWAAWSIAADTLKRGGGYFTLAGSGGPSYVLKFGADTFRLTSNGSASGLMRFDSAGNIICSSLFSVGSEDDGTGVAVDPSGYYVYMAGDLVDTTIFGNDTLGAGGVGGEMPYLVRWNPCGFSEGTTTIHSPHNTTVILFPNPNNGIFTIQANSYQLMANSSVEIYNMLGEKIYSSLFSTFHSQLSIALDTKSAGVYLYRVLNETGNLVGEGKFIIE